MESTAKEVASLEEKLQNVSLNYESTRDLLNTRLRALYENGFVNVWEVLLTAEGVTDFISKYNVIIFLVNYHILGGLLMITFNNNILNN